MNRKGLGTALFVTLVLFASSKSFAKVTVFNNDDPSTVAVIHSVSLSSDNRTVTLNNDITKSTLLITFENRRRASYFYILASAGTETGALAFSHEDRAQNSVELSIGEHYTKFQKPFMALDLKAHDVGLRWRHDSEDKSEDGNDTYSVFKRAFVKTIIHTNRKGSLNYYLPKGIINTSETTSDFFGENEKAYNTFKKGFFIKPGGDVFTPLESRE